MRSDIELSVIVAVKNAAATIALQLDALSSEAWAGTWEVVVVDNGSVDGTTQIVQDQVRNDQRFRLVVDDQQAGAGYARNVGMQHALGAAFAFCDADDLIETGWVGSMGSALRASEFVAGRTTVDRLNEPWLRTAFYAKPPDRLETFAGIFPIGATCNLGVRRSAIEAVGGFDTTFITGQDIELCLRLWTAGYALVYERDAVVHYRYRPTYSALWKRSRQYGAVAPAIAKHLDQLGLPSPGYSLGARNWLWLLRNLPRLRSKAGRARWLVVAGTRVGRIEGSIRSRRLLL